MNRPDPAPILDLIEAFRRSKTMFAALSFGIFDQLQREPQTPEMLARRTETDVDALRRLLDAVAALGLISRDEQNRYQNSPAAATYLAKQSPLSLAGYVKYSNEVLFPMWNHLEDAVREGSNRWEQSFGLTSGALFDRFFHTEEAMRTFLMGMHGFGTLSSPAVARAFDLGGFRRLVDLGGATGHFACAACEEYPRLRAVVFDLPRVIALARELIRKSPAAERVDCIAGDFFADSLPEGDLYVLGRILHDWPVVKIRELLHRIAHRLPAGGALLIAEKLLDEDHLGPVHAHMQSLNMLICTEGRERSLREYRELLVNAGFRSVEGVSTGSPLDAILARK